MNETMMSAWIREDAVVCVDEDADHDRVADGADHDSADEGANARLVDAEFADRVGGRLIVGSEDVLRCVSYGLYDSA
eukprot:436992-Prymnesium_polylepis.1